MIQNKMGDLSDNLITLGLGGLIAQGLVKEAKKGPTPRVCDNCGKVVKDLKGMCQAQHWDLKEGWLCSDCARICPKCEKVFCPKHIHNHNCKQNNTYKDKGIFTKAGWKMATDCIKEDFEDFRKNNLSNSKMDKESKENTEVECPHCHETLILDNEESSKLEKKGKVDIKCPECNEEFTCEN